MVMLTLNVSFYTGLIVSKIKVGSEVEETKKKLEPSVCVNLYPMSHREFYDLHVALFFNF